MDSNPSVSKIRPCNLSLLKEWAFLREKKCSYNNRKKRRRKLLGNFRFLQLLIRLPTQLPKTGLNLLNTVRGFLNRISLVLWQLKVLSLSLIISKSLKYKEGRQSHKPLILQEYLDTVNIFKNAFIDYRIV